MTGLTPQSPVPSTGSGQALSPRAIPRVLLARPALPAASWLAIAGALATAAALGLAIAALPLPVAAIGLLIVVAASIALASPRAALVLLLFSIPFSSWTKVPLAGFDVTATEGLVALVIVGWVARAVAARQLHLRVGPVILAGLAFLMAALLSTTTATDLPSAIEEDVKLAEMIAIALYAASSLRRPADIRVAMLTLAAAGAVEAIIGLGQFVTGSGPQNFAVGPFMRAYGDFAQPNAFAAYLAIILPIVAALTLLRCREQPLAAVAGLIIGGGIVASLSRGAWLGVSLSLIAMALVWSPTTRRALALGVVGVSGLGVIAALGVIPEAVMERVAVPLDYLQPFDVRTVETTPENLAVVERMAHWQAGWDMAMDHPITGVGPGNYDAAYTFYYLRDWRESLGHAHNYYLNTFAELGIIGLLTLAIFLVAIFARVVAAIRRAPFGSIERALAVGALGTAITISVHNTFDNVLIHGIGVQLGLVLGLVESIALQQGRAPSLGSERADRY